MHEHREVRVTARDTTICPFIAPELSPVRRVDLELDKGIPGWTDLDVKVTDLGPQNGLPVGLADRLVDELTLGKASPVKVIARREVSRKRPTTRRWI